MKITRVLSALVFLVSSGIALGAPAASDIAGDWNGTLVAGQIKLRLVFRISQTAGGGLTATMDSPDQGARGIRVDTVTLKGNTLRMEVNVAAGVYEGTLDDAGTKAVGQWHQAGRSFPLTLARTQPGAPAPPASSSTPTATEQLAASFVSLLARQEFQKATDQFDAAMKAAAPPDKLKAVWLEQLEKFGAFQATGSMRTEFVQQYQVVFVTCLFQKQRADVKVVFDQAGKISGLFFGPTQSAQYQPPEYARPQAFQEKEVVVGSGEWALPGTLSMPVGKGPCPAVVLVHGSGPNDRDETIGPNKPFRDLAWGLASQGIAVLRYEKRTKQYAARIAMSMQGFTVNEETIADALEAVSLLRKTDGVDPNRVFILGHSLGGMLAPRMGATRPDVAGLIIMAGVARPLEDLVLEQAEYQSSLAGDLSADQKARLQDLERQVAAIKNLNKEKPSKDLILDAPASYWLDLQGYDPTAVARTLKQPLLILQGENDCQVTSTDFARWKQALSGSKNATLKSYPTLNHLFMEVQGKSTGKEYELPSNVSETVINDLATWIKQH